LASRVRYQDGRILPLVLFQRRRTDPYRECCDGPCDGRYSLYLYLPRQGWMSEHFKTPEERGILIGLAVTFVFPMSAWMSSASVSVDGCQCSLLINLSRAYNSRILSCQARSRLPHRLQGPYRLFVGLHYADPCLQVVVSPEAAPGRSIRDRRLPDD
jgi:hypothetical protein